MLVRGDSSGEPASLTPAQQSVVAACGSLGSAVCVLGGPGTGKTTALVASVVAQVRAGVPLSSMVVLTGSRPAAQRLRTRIVSAVGSTQRGLQVTTVHGWCQHLLLRLSGPAQPLPRLLSAPEQEFRVRELLTGVDRDCWPAELWPALGTRGFARQVRAMLARVRQLGLDPDELAAAGQAAGRPEWVSAARFFNEYLDVLDAEGVIDYAELVHRTRLLLQEDSLIPRWRESAAMVFCDEFAELDRGMTNVLADAHRAGSSVVAFADPDTTIFGFRGADPRAVADFAERFHRPGAPAVTVRLDDNLRASPPIVDALRSVATRLPYRGVAHPAPVALSDEPAGVRVELVADGAGQVDRIAQVLRQAHLERGVAWSQMAVINPSGHRAVTTLASRLAAAGVPVQVAGDEIALSGEPAVQHLLRVLGAAGRLAEELRLDEKEAGRLLRTPMGGLDAMGLRRLGRALARVASAADPDQPVPSSARLIADELIRPALVPNDPGACVHTALGASVEVELLVRLRMLLTRLARSVEQRLDVSTILWQAWSGTSWPRILNDEALSGGEDAAGAHRSLDAVVALFDLAAAHPNWAGATGLRALIAEVAGQQIPADIARESDPARSGVAVRTVHRTRGEQWRLVVLVGLQEGQWPALAESSGLLRADLLTPDGLASPPTLAERMAEERRALLLGASRASEQLVVIAIDDPTGESDPPSRFVDEFAVPVRPADDDDSPGTLTGLVALLRRVVVDPRSGPDLRGRAAAELAWLDCQVDDDGRGLVAGANPQGWWGLRLVSRGDRPVVSADRPIRLSGSEVEQLLDCPRQWFMARRAGGQQLRGPEAAFGTLVHALVADAATRGVHAVELLDQMDEIWPRLAYGAEWLSMAEREAAEALLARYDSWAANPDHHGLLGVEVAFEVPVSIDGHELVVVGTVDRLEVDDLNRLRVIDFKTSRRALGADEVAVMDQLGVYQLAARSGAFDALSGGLRELADAQAVYLRVGHGDGPLVRSQPSLDLVPAPAGEPAQPGRTWVHDRLVQAAATIRSEDFHASPHPGCQRCAFRLGCPAQRQGGEGW